MTVSAGAWSPEALLSTLAGRAGGQARLAGERDAVAGVRPLVVVEPGGEEEVADILAFADAERLKVLVRGGGTQLGLGFAPAGGDILLSTARLNRVVEHEPGDMTATAEAGLTLAEFQAALGAAGQWLALDPALPPAATIGGIVATAASGAHRLRYGGVRDQIIGVRIARADGTIARGGGKVVKNVAGFDLPKLLTGSLGTLGVILSATFRLYPRAAGSRTVALAGATGPLCDLALRLIASTLVPSAIDVTGGTGDLGAAGAVRFEGSAEACEEQARELVALAEPLGIRGRILAQDEESGYWQGAQDEAAPADANGQHLALKVSLLPGEVGAWLDEARVAAIAAGVDATWRAHAGHGLIEVRLAGASTALPPLVAALRASATARRGTLVVADAPAALLGDLDPWGPSPALDLMRRVKAQFDPHGTLNPGRFVGGI